MVLANYLHVVYYVWKGHTRKQGSSSIFWRHISVFLKTSVSTFEDVKLFLLSTIGNARAFKWDPKCHIICCKGTLFHKIWDCNWILAVRLCTEQVTICISKTYVTIIISQCSYSIAVSLSQSRSRLFPLLLEDCCWSQKQKSGEVEKVQKLKKIVMLLLDFRVKKWNDHHLKGMFCW